MHPAQRRAIVAIITMLEQGLAQLKGIILADDPRPAVKSQDPVRGDDVILNDAEEDTLEEKMERERMAMVQEDERAAKALYGIAPEKTFQGRDPLHLFGDE